MLVVHRTRKPRRTISFLGGIEWRLQTGKLAEQRNRLCGMSLKLHVTQSQMEYVTAPLAGWSQQRTGSCCRNQLVAFTPFRTTIPYISVYYTRSQLFTHCLKACYFHFFPSLPPKTLHQEKSFKWTGWVLAAMPLKICVVPSTVYPPPAGTLQQLPHAHEWDLKSLASKSNVVHGEMTSIISTPFVWITFKCTTTWINKL